MIEFEPVSLKVSFPKHDFEDEEVVAVDPDGKGLVIVEFDRDDQPLPGLDDWCLASVDNEIALDGTVETREIAITPTVKQARFYVEE